MLGLSASSAFKRYTQTLTYCTPGPTLLLMGHPHPLIKHAPDLIIYSPNHPLFIGLCIRPPVEYVCSPEDIGAYYISS